MASKLPKIIKDFDALPESLREQLKDFYVEQADGTHALQVDGDPDKKKVDEFRENNRKLAKEKAEYEEKLKKYEGVPDEELNEFKTWKSEMEKNEDYKLIKEGKVDEVFNKRTESLKKSYEQKIKELQTNYETVKQSADATRSKLARRTLDQVLRDEVMKVGTPRPGAIEDILRRGREYFTLGEDLESIVPLTETGDDEGKVLSPATFAQQLVKTADWMFESSTGGNARGASAQNVRGKQIIDSNDPIALGRNIDLINSGKAVVR